MKDRRKNNQCLVEVLLVLTRDEQRFAIGQEIMAENEAEIMKKSAPVDLRLRKLMSRYGQMSRYQALTGMSHWSTNENAQRQ